MLRDRDEDNWRLQCRPTLKRIQHAYMSLKSLIAESRVVALCFDTSRVFFSIGYRYFFPSGPYLSIKMWASVYPPFTHLIKGHVRMDTDMYSLSAVSCVSCVSFLSPFAVTRLARGDTSAAQYHCSIEQ
jgi:hypothetical protein